METFADLLLPGDQKWCGFVCNRLPTSPFVGPIEQEVGPRARDQRMAGNFSCLEEEDSSELASSPCCCFNCRLRAAICFLSVSDGEAPSPGFFVERLSFWMLGCSNALSALLTCATGTSTCLAVDFGSVRAESVLGAGASLSCCSE